MRGADYKHRLTLDQYILLLEDLKIYCTSLLFAFAKNSTSVRDVIIRNFIARSITAVDSIVVLFQQGVFADCYILYRALVDRLFHLWALVDNNEFEVFERWSYIQQYNMRNRAWSDPDFRQSLNPELFHPTSDQTRKYNSYRLKDHDWQRPNAEKIAKQRGYRFLYVYGYNHPSSYVHPMASDGDDDFYRLTNIQQQEYQVDHRALLTNSFIILLLIVQEGLNAGNLNWRALVYNVLDSMLSYLGDEGSYTLPMAKMMKCQIDGVALCEPGDAQL